jgi:hypothetical protein
MLHNRRQRHALGAPKFWASLEGSDP